MKKIILNLICLLGIVNLTAQTTITVGSASTVNGITDSSPINIYYRSHHCQFIYTPADINGGGWTTAGIISKIGFNIFGTTSEALPNFSIKLKNTSSTNVNTYDAGGLNTVYTSASYFPVAGGFELLTLDNNFTWDGTSNLLVDVCFDQVSAYTSTGQIYMYAYTNTGAEYAYVREDSNPVCSFSTGGGGSGGYNSAYKPQIQFELTALPLCTGLPTAGDAVSTSTNVCENTAFNLNLINNGINSGLEYQWQSSPNGTVWTNLGSVQLTSLLNIPSISATTYYQCVTTCTASASSATSTPVLVNLNPPINCYCMPGPPTFMVDCTQDKITDFSIANVVSQTTNCDAYGFSDSTASIFTSVNLAAGNTYTLTVNTLLSGFNGNGIVGVWIDYDQSRTFDPNEFTSLGFGASGTYSNTITVPMTALGGDIRMRMALDAYYAYSGTILNPCMSNSGSLGQIIDYKVNMTPAPACSGAPNAGDAITSSGIVCTAESFTLDLINNSVASGISYQWQSSPNGTVWTNLGSAQNSIPYVVTSQTATTYYQCVTTCTSAALTGTSNPVTVTKNDAYNCLCIPESISCSSSQITNLAFENINHAPACSSGVGYVDYMSLATVSLTASQSYSIAIDLNSQGGNGYVGLWIDYDQSSTFEPSEYTYVGTTNGIGTLTTNIAVPFTATGGLTGMRVKMESTFGSFSGLDPCTKNEYDGQTLDYLINITPVTPCGGTPNAGDATSTEVAICENSPFTLDLMNNDIVSNITYQWQSSPDNVIWTNLGNVQSFVPYTVTNQTVTMHYRCLTTCTTSAQTATSSPVAVTQNPLTACYCVPPPSDCLGNDEINNVILSNLSNTSTCSTNGYEDYAGSVASATIQAGQTYTMTTVVGSDYNGNVTVWIDYDQNGVFDASEYTNLGSTMTISNYTISNSINVPVTALAGNTKMRVRNNYSGTFNPNDACASGGGGAKMGNSGQQALGGPPSAYGETEDYAITLLPPDCSSINFPPSFNVTGSTDICPAASTVLDITPTVQTATGITYEWFYFNGSSYVSTGAPSATSQYTAAPGVNTPYYCEVQCNASMVRASDTVMVNVRSITTAPVTTSATCNGLCDGNVTMNASSFGATLSYTWTPSVGTSDMAVALCAGLYTVDIMNPTGCSVTETVTILSPASIMPNPTSTDVTCFGANNGVISLVPTGGTGAYSYSWTPNVGTTATVTNLAAGNYSYMVLDANNCNATGTITISEPSALIATSSQTNISCFGLNDGIAMVTANGGTSPYTYTWSPGGNNTDNEINLSAGTYTCIIEDANLCSSTQTITIVEPSVLSSTATQTDVSCFGLSNGTASVTVNGGTGAYVYSWTPNISTTDVISSLSANSYTCVITDINLCSVTQTITITEPSALIATPSQTNVSCSGINDGAASINVIGGVSPLSFSWSPTGGTSLTASNLAAGNYTFSIIDGNSCSLNQTITITQPVGTTVTVTGPASACQNTSLGLIPTITGGATPFSYNWVENPGSVSVSSDSICVYAESIPSNYSYYLAVTDGNNCTVNSNTLNVAVNPSSNFSGTVTTNPNIPVAGRVILYQYLPFYTKFDSVAGQTIGAAGDFNFISFDAGIYIIKAIPSATNMPISYGANIGDTAVSWKDALQINHGCAVNDIQNIHVYPFPVITNTTGISGILSGGIYGGPSYGQRPGEFGQKPTIPGTPIGGIIVKGGKNPGGQMFVQTMTATDGTYTLSGLPANTGNESYFILVDIPGLDTNGTYHRVIDLTNNNFQGLDFLVDSAKVNPLPSSVISVHDISAIENQIKVFPNPAADHVTIQYSLQNSSTVKIELFDMLGRSVKMLLPETQQSMEMHKQSWQTNDLRSGLYFIKMTINGSESIIKLSVTN